MADLRLTGTSVAALRSLLNISPIAHVIWSVMCKDFRVPEMRATVPKRPLDPAPFPIPGRPPHQWHDAELGVPEVTGGRQSGAQMRAAFAGGASPESVLDRILSEHKSLGVRSPFLEIDEDRSRAQAKASAARYKSGTALGPLDGIPVPIKDQFDLKGVPTRGGAAYREELVTEDSWVVKQLDRAGSVIVGKTHAVEWGLNPVGIMEHFVGPRNPYNPERAPGGSSTGSGVAVSLGLCPSAVGSDGGGSIRIPAALTGVFGIKPSFVRVGRTGDCWSGGTVGHTGPIAQTVEDLVDQLEALTGVDPDDLVTRFAPDGHQNLGWRKALGRGVRGCRIGVMREDMKDADPAIVQAVLTALSALEAEGAVIVDVEIPTVGLVNAIGAIAIASDTAANLANDLKRFGPQFGHELAIVLRMMSLVPASDYLLAGRLRADLRRNVATAFCDVDLLAMPTTATVAPPYAQSDDKTAILAPAGTAAMTRFNFLGNLMGLPAGTVPVAMHDGLPVGLQLIGDAWDEASVFAAMAHCERIGLHDAVKRPAGFVRLFQ